MPLFEVQDADRPLYVFANSWKDALDCWQRVCAQENADTHPQDHQPDGIRWMASDTDVMISIYRPPFIG